MATIVTRSGKGSALTHVEMDANFTNLNNDKVEAIGSPATGAFATFDANDDIEAGYTLTTLAAAINAIAYPVGSIYTNAAVSTNPATLLGFGTWTAFGAGKVMVGLDSGDTDFDTLEETGGAKTHTLTIDEMPAHTHTHNYISGGTAGGGTFPATGAGSLVTGSTGGGSAHNNLQPYIVVYMWKRTA